MSILNRLPCDDEYFTQLLKKLGVNKDIHNFREDLRRSFSIDHRTIHDLDLKGVHHADMNHFIAPTMHDNSLIYCGVKKEYARCYSTVTYIDMIGLKAINEAMSERTGSALIAYVSDFLTENLDKGVFLVNRKGGDEFHVFNMSNVPPECKEKYGLYVSSANRPAIRTETDIFSDLQKQIREKPVCLYFSNNSNTSYCLKKQVDGEGENWFDIEESASYRYRILLQGITFRFGIGADEDEAWQDADYKKENEKSMRRGDFNDEVRIGIISEDDIRYFDPHSHIFLIVDPGDGESRDDELLEILRSTLIENGYNPLMYTDKEFPDVTYIVIGLEKTRVGKLITAYTSDMSRLKTTNSELLRDSLLEFLTDVESEKNRLTDDLMMIYTDEIDRYIQLQDQTRLSNTLSSLVNDISKNDIRVVTFKKIEKLVNDRFSAYPDLLDKRKTIYRLSNKYLCEACAKVG
ncbi:MAG: hypothetical protein LBV09_02055 [Deferribacteraceae bacterium]|jgi:GGDEF domain-containing protein|nr:hypothetical protein [Deferribacteraceae bacterium]